ncbi:19948_t:CDS:2 [Funneliformis geosporum]|nr:19948_t:CDS:2 [Funneliformis geosporum]
MVAINKGEYCILNEYINGLSHLRWKCAKGHEWNATLESVKNRDSWYPICAGYAEFGAETQWELPPSENFWPDFLKTSKYSRGLQLDIFYQEYGFAIEVQGEQHEKYIEFFHRDDPKNFIKQQTQV